MAPPFGASLVVQYLRESDLLAPLLREDSPAVAVVLLCFAAAGGLALPMLYRILFSRAHRTRESVPPEAFFRFENNAIMLASFPAWCLLADILLGLSLLYTLTILLVALYAAYAHFPSGRLLSADAHIFRVRL
jgi:hypothetical protein